MARRPIGVIAEGFRPYLESLGVEAGRIRRMRNWTHVRRRDDRPRRRCARSWTGRRTRLVCLHAGNMGFKQGLENVRRGGAAGADAAADARLLFVFVGDGNQREALEALAAKYALTNVRFVPLQSEEVFPSVLAAADMLLVNQRGSVDDMSLPSKLTSYFAAGRPVVAAAASAQRDGARDDVRAAAASSIASGRPARAAGGVSRA